MRFIMIVIAVALIAVIGLFVYGQLLEPETRMIEQEALRGGAS